VHVPISDVAPGRAVLERAPEPHWLIEFVASLGFENSRGGGVREQLREIVVPVADVAFEVDGFVNVRRGSDDACIPRSSIRVMWRVMR